MISTFDMILISTVVLSFQLWNRFSARLLKPHNFPLSTIVSSQFPVFPSSPTLPLWSISQTTDYGGIECSDRSAVPAVRCPAIPQQLRATAGPHPSAPGAALPAVHAAALPGPAGPATGTMYPINRGIDFLFIL